MSRPIPINLTITTESTELEVLIDALALLAEAHLEANRESQVPTRAHAAVDDTDCVGDQTHHS